MCIRILRIAEGWIITMYTSRLAAGLGMIEETYTLLDLWQAGMDTATLDSQAVQSGRFAGVSARRIHNMVSDGFALRYLVDDGLPARWLQSLRSVLTRSELEQLMFLYTCRAHPVLADFVREVYWPAYAAGRSELSNAEARTFVAQANRDGKTTTPWTDETIRRMAGYLTGCLADFGLLERGRRTSRRILSYRVEARVMLLLAYDLHFAGLGDNSVLAHPDWTLFGLHADEVLQELKRLALRGWLIIQTAGTALRIGWPASTREEVADVLAQG
jgi:hypothetical protein